MNKKSHENLIPFTERTKSEQRAIAIKGGKASGKARREQRRLKDIAKLMMSMTIGEGRLANLEKINEITDVPNKKITVADAIVLVQMQKAIKGDTKSFELIRDLIGEKPKDQSDDTDEITNVDKLLQAMNERADDE